MRVNRIDFAKFCREYDYPIKGCPRHTGEGVDQLVNLEGVEVLIAGTWYEAEDVFKWLHRDGLIPESPLPIHREPKLNLEEVYLLC